MITYAGNNYNPPCHAWKIHGVKEFVYYVFSNCRGTQNNVFDYVVASGGTISPFTSTDNYDLFLIEIKPEPDANRSQRSASGQDGGDEPGLNSPGTSASSESSPASPQVDQATNQQLRRQTPRV